ncbi:MAG: energy transducer TonB [Acidobacteriota bacterium]
MMKKALLITLTLAILAPFILAQNPPPPPPRPPALLQGDKSKAFSEWQAFTSTEGNFSFASPKKPAEMTQDVQTQMGKVSIKMFVMQNAMVGYLAMYADYPIIFDTPASIKSSLDGARDLMLASRGGKVVSEREISYGGFTGREFRATTRDGVLRARMLLVYQRVFMLMAMMPDFAEKDALQSENTDKFFASFKLLKAPDAPPPGIPKTSEMESQIENIAPPKDFLDRPISWREFNSQEFSFKLDMPSEPHHQAVVVNPNDHRLDIHLWMAKGEEFVSQVMVQPFLAAPRNEAHRDLIFKYLMEGMLEDGEMKLISEQAITFQNYPGREYKLQMPFAKATAKAFLAGSNVYMLLAIPLNGEMNSAGINRFFNSFKVTKVPTPAKDSESADPPPPADPPKMIQPPVGSINVSGGVLQANAIRKIQPEYPPIAKAARASGEVRVQVLVSETGEVIEAAVISGHPLLRDAALQAAQKWQFKPTELSGKPVKVLGILTFNFALQ